MAVAETRIATGRSEACVPPAMAIAGVHDHGGAHAGHWHRGEYSCVQCAQQRADPAAVLP